MTSKMRGDAKRLSARDVRTDRKAALAAAFMAGPSVEVMIWDLRFTDERDDAEFVTWKVEWYRFGPDLAGVTLLLRLPIS